LTAGTHQGDGRQENIGPADDLDAPDETFYAPQLRITTKRFDMNMRWSHVEDNGLARSQVWLTNVDTTTPVFDEWYANPYYLYGTPNPAIDPDCPPGTPGHLCGDLYNKVATNFPGSNESVSDLGTAYASYQISENINVRYNFSISDVNSASWADSDFTAREALADDHTRPADAPELTEWENSAYFLPFEYQEMSHELTFTGFAGNFNYVGGLFYYENDRSWTINSFALNTPWRFMTADEHAQMNSPIWGFWPAEGCQDTLAMISALGYGTSDPSQAHLYEGLYYYCPSGSDHSQTLEYFTQSSSDTKAAFFSGNYRFNPNWALSGGLRYTEDTKSQTTAQQGGFFLFEFGSLVGITFAEGEGFEAQGFGDEMTWKRPIGHLALEYTTDTGQLVYGRISTGYRAGGFNLSNVPGSVPPFIKEETLVNYELGTKGAFFNSRLQLAAGVWYYDFQDYQLAATQEQPPGVMIPISQWDATPLVEYTANIPDTSVWGLDLEFSSYIGNHWMLRGFYAYQDSEIGPHSSVLIGDPDAEFGEWEHIDFLTGQVVTSPYPLPTDQTGNSLPMQPKNKLALTGGFNSPLGQSGGDLQIFATYSFTDERFADIGNLEYWKLPSYDRVDASIAWTPRGGKWTVALFGKNLTNEIGIVELNPGLSAVPALGYLTHAREIGLQLYWRPFN
jgi:outer membrane receptor protein involved in Fe transport